MKSNENTHTKVGLLRRAANTEQKQIAAFIGIKQPYFSKLENGHLPFPDIYLERFCKLFDIRTSDFHSCEPIDLVGYFYRKRNGKLNVPKLGLAGGTRQRGKN